MVNPPASTANSFRSFREDLHAVMDASDVGSEHEGPRSYEFEEAGEKVRDIRTVCVIRTVVNPPASITCSIVLWDLHIVMDDIDV